MEDITVLMKNIGSLMDTNNVVASNAKKRYVNHLFSIQQTVEKLKHEFVTKSKSIIGDLNHEEMIAFVKQITDDDTRLLSKYNQDVYKDRQTLIDNLNITRNEFAEGEDSWQYAQA